MNDDIVISARGLGKTFSKGLRLLINPLSRGVNDNSFWALRNLDFDIRRGEGVGIIGHNGAGKSTLLKILARIMPPTTGEFRMRGRVNSLLEIGTGFQPDLSGRANIYLNASILGLSKQEITELFDEIVAFSGVADFIDMPVRHYSSGMYSRLAFAVAAHVTGSILLVDEVLSVGDAEFRRKSLSRMTQLMESEQRTVLFVSHSMDAILRFCSRAMWLEKGQLRMFGDSAEVVRDYLNRVTNSTVIAMSADLSRAGPVNTPRNDGVGELPSAERPDGKASQSIPSPVDVAKNPTDGAVVCSLVVTEQMGESDTADAYITRLALLDGSENPQFAFFRDEPIRALVNFRVNRHVRMAVLIAVRCGRRKGVPDETHVFSDCCKAAEFPPGEHALSAILPRHLFASGTYYLTFGLVTPGKPTVRHHMLKRILAFQIADREDESEVLGDYQRGVVRPSIVWSADS